MQFSFANKFHRVKINKFSIFLLKGSGLRADNKVLRLPYSPARYLKCFLHHFLRNFTQILSAKCWGVTETYWISYPMFKATNSYFTSFYRTWFFKKGTVVFWMFFSWRINRKFRTWKKLHRNYLTYISRKFQKKIFF